MNKGKFVKLIKSVTAAALILTAVFCICKRFPETFNNKEALLTAAAFTLTDGKYMTESGEAPKPAETEPSTEAQPQTTAPFIEEEPSAKPKRDKSGYYDSYAAHSGEAVYDIAEKTIYPDGTKVGEGYIKNSAGLDVDFWERLNAPLTFTVKKNAEAAQVLIYHTHTGESYLDENVDYFYESYYSRTNNNDYNVCAVGEEIKRVLEKNGIKTLHDTTVHDSTYNGSYDRSAVTVLEDMKRNPEIKVVLDIHRDALGTDECKVKTTFEYKGKKGAQIMILSGCDPDNERGFTGWQNNLSFALKLESKAEELYPGMTRAVSFNYFAYNEYICDGSLLIEIGTDANTIDEAEYSGRLLGDVLSKVLTEDKSGR